MALINEDQVMKALDFALEHNVHSMKLSLILENVEMARAAGDDEKATMIVKRLQRLKKYDEQKLQTTEGYKPLLVDE